MVPNILFWTPTQLGLMSSIRNQESLVFCGSYGTGKTCLLVAAAMRAAQYPQKDVYFIITAGWGGKVYYDQTTQVLEVELRERFRGTSVRVLSLDEIRRDFLRLEKKISGHEIIRQFMRSHGGPNVAVFADEFPVSDDD